MSFLTALGIIVTALLIAVPTGLAYAVWTFFEHHYRSDNR